MNKNQTRSEFSGRVVFGINETYFSVIGSAYFKLFLYFL